MRAGYLKTLLVGVLAIAILCPLTQFLTVMTVNASVETATPVAWAVGLLFSTVTAAGLFWVVARRRLFEAPHLALFYAMLALAVPLMNIGLVRQFYHALRAVQASYLGGGSNTYRLAYQELEPNWFPVVPTREGLAWAQADRSLRLLVDAPRQRAERERERRLQQLLAAAELGAPEKAEVVGLLQAANGETLIRLEAAKLGDRLRAVGLGEEFDQALTAARATSAEALATLATELAPVTEWVLSLLPAARAALDINSANRTEQELRRNPDRAAQLRAEVTRWTPAEARWRELLAKLLQADRQRLVDQLEAANLRRFESLTGEALAAERSSFVFRLSQIERYQLMRQDGLGQSPNMNLEGLGISLWPDAASAQQRNRAPWWENLQVVLTRLPWHLWLLPLLLWAVLFTVVFLFLMCVAEWLRRKWVERENLPFPQVELVDNLIRHDKALEQAADVLQPPARSKAWSPLLWYGIAIGAIILTAEALGHYGFLPYRTVLHLDLKATAFEANIFSGMVPMHFVISPIVAGIVFLLGLEVSFSIWAGYLLYVLVTWVLRLGMQDIRDPNFTGFEGGRLYPFQMEQLLGASLFFAAFLVWRAWPKKSDGVATPSPLGRFVPGRWATVGLVVLPLVMIGLFWSMGITDLAVIIAFLVVTLAVTLADARLRAETGLPGVRSTYEMTKLPIILGLPGAMGASTFATYINIVFLPGTLLLRTLPQHLENLELARRLRLPYKWLAVGSLLAFGTAAVVGLFSFLIFSYYNGGEFHSGSFTLQGGPDSSGLASYPLWVSHFLGEAGLTSFDQPNWLRLGVVAIGAGVCGLLVLLRARFMGFPLLPVGYLLALFAVHFNAVGPYPTTADARTIEASVLWGSALVAWLIKSLIVKYGGMNIYKSAKPLFIGLALGGILAVFGWNVLDLGLSLATGLRQDPGLLGQLARAFGEAPPFTPKFY